MAHSEPLFLFQTSTQPSIHCPQCSSDQYRKKGKNKGTATQIYRCNQCGRTFTPSVALQPEEWIVNPQAEYAKDIWDCRCLGMDGGIGKLSHKLNFTHLTQPWLKQTAKQYLKMCLSSIAFASTQEKLYSLRNLSRFLAENYPDIEPVEITRAVITEFTIDLAGRDLAAQTRYRILSDAKQFFDAYYQDEWLNVSRYLVRQEDFPKIPKHLPRYIPEMVCYPPNNAQPFVCRYNTGALVVDQQNQLQLFHYMGHRLGQSNLFVSLSPTGGYAPKSSGMSDTLKKLPR